MDSLTLVHRETFDVLMLDVLMPGGDGLAVGRVLRSDGYRTRVLMLTARQATADRVAGLDPGAEDYLPKPVALDGLLARLPALLRRAPFGPTAAGAGGVLRRALLAVAPSARRARWADEEPQHSNNDGDLPELLTRNNGLAVDRTTSYQRILGYDFSVDPKTPTGCIGYMCRKLAEAGPSRRIHALGGAGYAVRPW